MIFKDKIENNQNNSHKLGLKLWSINTDNYLYEAIRLFENGFFDYIELYMVPDNIDKLKNWQIAKKNHNIPFTLHAPHFMHGFNLAKSECKEKNYKIYEEVKIFADELNAPFIIFHGGIDGDIKETAKQLSSFQEPRALIENKPFEALPNKMNGRFCRGYSFSEIQLVQNVSGCGFCLDIGHAVCSANSQQKEIYSYVEDFLNLKPNMFHLTDNEDITSVYDSHLHLGDGDLNLSKIKEILPKNATITLETIKNSKNNLDDFIEDVEYWKNLK